MCICMCIYTYTYVYIYIYTGWSNKQTCQANTNKHKQQHTSMKTNN